MWMHPVHIFRKKKARSLPPLVRLWGGMLGLCLAAFATQAQQPKPNPIYTPHDPYPETLEAVRMLQKKGDFPAAYKTLRQYIVPRDPQAIPAEAIWYAAQLAYLNQDAEAAGGYYDKVFARLSKDPVFIADYGGFLMNQRQYRKAIGVLKQQQDDALNRLYLARTYYWQGDYLRARKVIQTFSAQEREMDFIRDFIYEFNLAKSARLEAGLVYHTDDQPLQYTQENFRIARKFNNFLEPLAEVNLGQFASDSGSAGATILRLGNRFHINPIKTDVTVRLGNFSIRKDAGFLYQLQLRTQLSGIFSIDANLGREPYLYTIASTVSPVTYDDKTLALNVDSRWLQGRFQYSANDFGGNTINNTSLWLLIPVLNKKTFRMKLGYAYQYSNADSSRYVPKASPVTMEKNIAGIYNPYFTPANQQIHNVLLQLQVFPASRLSFSASASVALSATIDNPYLYTVQNANGDVSVVRGFLPTGYHPAEGKLSADYKVSDRLRLTAGYQYANLFFYKGHSLNLSSSILF